MQTAENTPEQARAEARRLLKQGKIQDAADVLWETVESRRKDAATWHMLANLYRNYSDRPSVTEDLYDKTIKLALNNPTVYADLGLHRYSMRQYDEAVGPLRKSIELDDTFLLAHRTLGLTLKQLDKFEEAGEYLHTVHKLNPDDPATICGLLTLHLLQKDIEAARELLASYVQHAGLSDQQATTLRDAFSKEGIGADTWLTLVDILFAADRPFEALDTGYSAVNIHETNVELWFTLYRIEMSLGQDWLADEALNRAMLIDPHHQGVMRANALWWYDKGLIYDAERYLVEYCQMYPDDWEMRKRLEELYRRMDLFEAQMQEMEAQAE